MNHKNELFQDVDIEKERQMTLHKNEDNVNTTIMIIYTCLLVYMYKKVGNSGRLKTKMEGWDFILSACKDVPDTSMATVNSTTGALAGTRDSV